MEKNDYIPRMNDFVFVKGKDFARYVVISVDSEAKTARTLKWTRASALSCEAYRGLIYPLRMKARMLSQLDGGPAELVA
jgi:hypothetical protein